MSELVLATGPGYLAAGQLCTCPGVPGPCLTFAKPNLVKFSHSNAGPTLLPDRVLPGLSLILYWPLYFHIECPNEGFEF
jgi:hypothetical protein